MARKIVSKTSFLGGEAGPLLEGRSDLAQFQLGAAKLENFIALKGGAITRRPGTRYVTDTLNDTEARLFPFIVSYDDADKMFVLEISVASSTSLAFRIIRVSDNAIYSVTVAPASTTLTVATMSAGALNKIQVAQSADTLFIVSDGFTPQILERTTAAPTFTLTPYLGAIKNSRFSWFASPYRDPNVDTALTLSISNASVGTGRTLTASSAFFDAGHVGAWFRTKVSSTDGYCLVTGYTSSTAVTVSVVLAFGGTGATSDWSEGSWSTYRGFPRSSTFYDQRLVFGGNTSEPDTFWMSEVSDYFQMSASTTGISDPLQFTLASDKLNQIRWMVGGKKLTIGTSSSEWVGVVTNDGTNLHVQFDEETNHGSAPVKPQKSAYTIPFVQRSGQSIREMAFSFDSDSYIATDLSLFASHIGTQYGDFNDLSQAAGGAGNVTIVQMAYQESPFNVLWVLDSLGRVYGMTRDRQQQIAAWHSHSLGGSTTGEYIGQPAVIYPPRVLSICVVPNPDGRRDRLWMVVERTINSAVKYHVEYIDDIKTNFTLAIGNVNDPKPFLDCSSVHTKAGSDSTAWAGWTRFASGTAFAVVLTNSGVLACAEVVTVDSSGNFTTTAAGKTVAVGFLANAEMRLLPFEGGANPELYMRSEKRADTAAVRLYQTFGLKVGKNRISRRDGWVENTSFEAIPFITGTQNYNQTRTFTGIKDIKIPTDLDYDGSFSLVMDSPWPCTILSICSRVVANEI